ncbi:probable protein phosphatase 2C 8 [Salvia hispanica]|uniref:probable protein phosphatase 2C 8 n=1 Tax=Salvia hispanica TaxID=49212 RepID=UPI0020092AD6|nr:probable protein phosphatase 2C 8 [Salvia hispanica]
MPHTTLPCSPSKSAESHASKSAKDARRRRRELRRIRSLPVSTSAAALEDDTPPSLRRKTSYGKISVVGRRREMHDAVAVELGFLKRDGQSYDFFGVFEGHRVGLACRERLAEIVGEETDQRRREWEEVMREAFQKVAALMGLGSVAVVGETEVVVAGSKAVLCRGGEAVRLLESEEEEAEQVKVRGVRRSGEDEFLILGSDGFWDVISDDLPYQIATRYCATPLDDGAEKAVAVMAEMALALGSKHNVSVVLVDLRKPNASQQSGFM